MILVIDPATLRRGQRAGRRCAVSNCRRLLSRDGRYQVGVLPDRRPVNVCEECAPTFPLSDVMERIAA